MPWQQAVLKKGDDTVTSTSSNLPPQSSIWRTCWLNVKAGHPVDWDTLLFHRLQPPTPFACAHECVCVWGLGDSLLPIVLSFPLHSHSASCSASCKWGREEKTEREKRWETKMEEKEKTEDSIKSERVSKCRESNDLKCCVCVCVLVCWPALLRWIPCWEQLIGSSLHRKGCVILLFVSVTMEEPCCLLIRCRTELICFFILENSILFFFLVL